MLASFCAGDSHLSNAGADASLFLQSVDDIFFGGGSQTKDFLGEIGDNLGGGKDKK